MPRWIVQIVGTTIVCAVTGWLALLTAHSSTIGPAVWPPVGIGLVAVLVFGNRMGWGIWFSTFFLLVIDAQRYRSGSDLSPIAFVTFAAGMASVYSVQALLGAWGIRKVLGGSVVLLRVRDIAVFLIVVGRNQQLTDTKSFASKSAGIRRTELRSYASQTSGCWREVSFVGVLPGSDQNRPDKSDEFGTKRISHEAVVIAS